MSLQDYAESAHIIKTIKENNIQISIAGKMNNKIILYTYYVHCHRIPHYLYGYPISS